MDLKPIINMHHFLSDADMATVEERSSKETSGTHLKKRNKKNTKKGSRKTSPSPPTVTQLPHAIMPTVKSKKRNNR